MKLQILLHRDLVFLTIGNGGEIAAYAARLHAVQVAEDNHAQPVIRITGDVGVKAVDAATSDTTIRMSV